MVIVHDENQLRGKCRIGRVEAFVTGSDGHVGGAIFRVKTKAGRLDKLRRPLQRLYPLEVRCRNDEPETTISFRRVEPGPTVNSVRSEQHPELSDRPRRVPTNSGSSPEKENTAKEFDVRNLSDFELRTVVVVVSIPF